jgi:CRP-like cAMP-binding protein
MDDLVAGSLEPFFQRIEHRDTLGPAERQALLGGVSTIENVSAGSDLVQEGDRPQQCTLLVSGFSARYRLVASGERQFAAIHVGGDFIDLHSFPLKEMDHSVLALTDCKIALFPHPVLKGLTENYPHLTRVLWLLTLLDSALHREWIMCLGRLSAAARAAHLFCELGMRLAAVGLGRPDSYRLPLTQQDLADALGVSSVHANRVIQSLRSEGLLVWQSEQVTLPDLQRIRALGEFDERYLHLVKEPR